MPCRVVFIKYLDALQHLGDNGLGDDIVKEPSPLCLLGTSSELSGISQGGSGGPVSSSAISEFQDSYP